MSTEAPFGILFDPASDWNAIEGLIGRQEEFSFKEIRDTSFDFEMECTGISKIRGAAQRAISEIHKYYEKNQKRGVTFSEMVSKAGELSKQILDIKDSILTANVRFEEDLKQLRKKKQARIEKIKDPDLEEKYSFFGGALGILPPPF